MKTLFLITARGGSKGIPKKNIREMCGKPLLSYSIDFARKFSGDEDIFVSTDSEEIKSTVENYGLKIPFVRPDYLAQDGSGSFEVIQHALAAFKGLGIEYDTVVLLQPTSPLREKQHLTEAMQIFEQSNNDAIYSVQIADATPTYRLYKEIDGVLVKCEDSKVFQRQMDAEVYKVNGSIYVFKSSIFENYNSFSEIKKVGKYVMGKLYSFEIDDELDWSICEMLMKKNFNS